VVDINAALLLQFKDKGNERDKRVCLILLFSIKWPCNMQLLNHVVAITIRVGVGVALFNPLRRRTTFPDRHENYQ
jgi:hypothetical protein